MTSQAGCQYGRVLWNMHFGMMKLRVMNAGKCTRLQEQLFFGVRLYVF